MFYLSLIVVAIASRLLPHPPNVAFVGALGLFAGCYLSGRKAFLVPVAVLLVSDVIGHLLRVPGMGFYNPLAMIGVYGGAMLAVPVGRLVGQLRESGSVVRFCGGLFGGSLIASTLFFLVSNFGVWCAGWYPMTPGGLAACFVAAVPFFGYTLAGDLMFSGLLFGSYEVSQAKVGARRATLAGGNAFESFRLALPEAAGSAEEGIASLESSAFFNPRNCSQFMWASISASR